MGVIESIRNYLRELRELEDEDVRKVLNDNYGPILRLNNVLSYIDEGYIPLYIFHSIAFNLIVYSYLYLFSITCYLLKDDFILVGVQFHYLLMALAGSVFQFLMYFRRRELIIIHKAIAVNFYQYAEDHLMTEEKEIFKKNMIKQRFYLIPFLILVGIVGIFIVGIGPLIDTMVGAGHNSDYFNGVYMKTPIPMYFPFEIDSMVTHCVATGFQIITVVMLALSISGVIFIYIVTTQNLTCQFKILIVSLRKLFVRSQTRYENLYPGRKILKSRMAHDETFQDCMSFCLKENIKHHLAIKKYFVNHATLIGIPLLVAFFMATAVLALSMVILAEKTERIGLLLTNTLAMIGELGNLFIVCYFGEEIISVSEELFTTVYSLKWYLMSRKNKNLILSFQDGTREPLIARAILIFTCSMETFSSICNSAYSYFNMLSASNASKQSDN